ncbi:hypothetical protein SAMN05421868_10340 [Paenibacillus naphthalenovorans]|nr:hypothetical protein SAMN05421868_10340 [Paenibacillus naphthalenovorans]
MDCCLFFMYKYSLRYCIWNFQNVLYPGNSNENLCRNISGSTRSCIYVFLFFGLPILWGIEVPGMLAAVLLHKLYDEYLKKEFGPEINPDDIVVEGGKL